MGLPLPNTADPRQQEKTLPEKEDDIEQTIVEEAARCARGFDKTAIDMTPPGTASRALNGMSGNTSRIQPIHPSHQDHHATTGEPISATNMIRTSPLPIATDVDPPCGTLVAEDQVHDAIEGM